MNLFEVVQRVVEITEDRVVGKPSPTTRPNGDSSVTFRGTKGWYDVVDLPNQGMTILFLEGRDKPTSKIIGIYYTQPQPEDMNAAKLIPQILTAVGSLDFQYGYMSTDQNGVNWKRFISSSGEFVLKTRKEGANTVCEIIAGALVVTMKIMANGVVEDICEIPTSRL